MNFWLSIWVEQDQIYQIFILEKQHMTINNIL